MARHFSAISAALKIPGTESSLIFGKGLSNGRIGAQQLSPSTLRIMAASLVRLRRLLVWLCAVATVALLSLTLQQRRKLDELANTTTHSTAELLSRRQWQVPQVDVQQPVDAKTDASSRDVSKEASSRDVVVLQEIPSEDEQVMQQAVVAHHHHHDHHHDDEKKDDKEKDESKKEDKDSHHHHHDKEEHDSHHHHHHHDDESKKEEKEPKDENSKHHHHSSSHHHHHHHDDKKKDATAFNDTTINNTTTLLLTNFVDTHPSFQPWPAVTTKPKHRPPLTDLIRDTDRAVHGHVSWTLDWAVLGHAKSATSFIMKWLDRHVEIATWREEVCDLYDNRPAGLISRLYQELPTNMNLRRGFKCPGHFSRRSLRYFARYFSQTRLIVGIRHPVRWFESFYNFRVRHGGNNYTLPDPHLLIGACTPSTDGICTDRANFHTNLGILGKTNLSNPVEQALLRFPQKYMPYESSYPIHNPLFVYDVAQFYDTDPYRQEQFKLDLQRFLGLTLPLPEPTDKDKSKSSRHKHKAIDICDDQFIELRKELTTIGHRASHWIRYYLLESPEVYVSSRDYLDQILAEWKLDPCTEQLQFEGNNTKEVV